MATYLIDPGGGGDFTTIAAAYAALNSGDTLILQDGATFAEGAIVAPGAQNTVTIQRSGDGPSPPVWDFTGHASAGSYYTDWTVTGIRFTAGGGSGVALVPRSGAPHRLTVEDCTADACGGLVSGMGTDSRVERVTLDTCGGATYAIWASAGASGVEVRAALLIGCSAGVYTGGGGGSLAEHVTAADGSQASGVAVNAGTGTARNVIVSDPGPTLSAAVSAGTYEACCVGNLAGGVVAAYSGHTIGTPPAGSLEADPLFHDAASGDYRPGIASPCRGTGSASATTAQDATGEPWPVPRSMGALVAVQAAGDTSRRPFAWYLGDGPAVDGLEVLSLYPPPGEWSGASWSDLESAVILSLFTDAREPGDLPAGETRRRGWWAAAFAGADLPAGSRLWTLDRAAGVQPERVRGMIAEALAWMTEAGIATAIAVDVTPAPGQPWRFDAVITITRSEGTAPEILRWADLWRRHLELA